MGKKRALFLSILILMFISYGQISNTNVLSKEKEQENDSKNDEDGQYDLDLDSSSNPNTESLTDKNGLPIFTDKYDLNSSNESINFVDRLFLDNKEFKSNNNINLQGQMFNSPIIIKDSDEVETRDYIPIENILIILIIIIVLFAILFKLFKISTRKGVEDRYDDNNYKQKYS